MIKIHAHLSDIKNYIGHTIANMRNLLGYSDNLNTYSEFNMALLTKLNTLSAFKDRLDIIMPYKLSPAKISGLGHVLKCFYELYDSKVCEECMMYSFGFNGYIDNIEGFIEHMNNKRINCVKFISGAIIFLL